jgi:hypothetical protein
VVLHGNEKEAAEDVWGIGKAICYSLMGMFIIGSVFSLEQEKERGRQEFVKWV